MSLLSLLDDEDTPLLQLPPSSHNPHISSLKLAPQTHNPHLCLSKPDMVPPPEVCYNDAPMELPTIIVSDYDWPSYINTRTVFNPRFPWVRRPHHYSVQGGPISSRKESDSPSNYPRVSPSPNLLTPSNGAKSKRDHRYQYRAEEEEERSRRRHKKGSLG